MSRSGVPQHDLEAERVVISAVVLDPTALSEVRSIMAPEDCYDPKHRAILGAIYELDDRTLIASVPSIVGRLRETGKLEAAGGVAHVADVIDATPAIAHAAQHARRVASRALLRRCDAVATTIANEARAGVPDVAAWIDGVRTRIHDATDQGKLAERDSLGSARMVRGEIAELVRSRREDDGTAGIPTGLPSLDRQMGRVRRGALQVIAARPGVGKSAVGMQIATDIARRGLGALVCSLEMDRVDLASRAVARLSRVEHSRIESGRLGARDAAAVDAACAQFGELPLLIDDAATQTVASIRATVKRSTAWLRGTHGPDARVHLLVVDYLQLVRVPEKRGQSRTQAIGEITRGLLALAKELDVAVLALAQLNRESDRRSGADRRPQLTDLRESGDIENDARAVVMLYREDLAASHGPIEFLVRKCRQGGRVGTVQAHWSGPIMCVTELETAAPPPEADFADGLDDPARPVW